MSRGQAVETGGDVEAAALSNDRLAYKRCGACGEAHYYPRPHCPFCLSDETRWEETAGNGTLYSFSVTQADNGPHILAFVTLEEGFTMMSALIDCEPEKVRIGMPVRLAARTDTDGKLQPFFTGDGEGQAK